MFSIFLPFLYIDPKFNSTTPPPPKTNVRGSTMTGTSWEGIHCPYSPIPPPRPHKKPKYVVTFDRNQTNGPRMRQAI